jgi:hypothetical protein
MAYPSTAGEIDDTAMQYFKVNVVFPFIDHCLMQLDHPYSEGLIVDRESRLQ